MPKKPTPPTNKMRLIPRATKKNSGFAKGVAIPNAKPKSKTVKPLGTSRRYKGL